MRVLETFRLCNFPQAQSETLSRWAILCGYHKRMLKALSRWASSCVHHKRMPATFSGKLVLNTTQVCDWHGTDTILAELRPVAAYAQPLQIKQF